MKREEHKTKLFRQRPGGVAKGKRLKKKNHQPFPKDKNSHQLLEKTFASLREAVFILDAKTTRILNCNPAASQIFGYEKEEMLGETTKFLHADEERLEEFRGRLLSAVEERGCFELPEFQMKRRNGEVFFTDHSVMPLEDDEGKRIGWVSVVRDITERKRAEKALRESQTLLRTVMEGTPDPIYVKDRQSRILLGNSALAKVAGKPIEEILGKTDSEYYGDTRIGQALRDHDLRVMESGQSEAMEETVSTPDGYRIFLSSKTPYRDAAGNIVGTFGISHDITGRKKAEQELRESEAKSNALIKYAPTGIYELDYRTGRFLSVNDAMCQILGYTREELLAMGAMPLLDEKSRELFASRIKRQLAGEKIEESVEYRVRKKDGGVIDAILNVSFNPSGDKPNQALVVAYDITERKRMEEELRRSHAELELRVLERTKEVYRQAELLDLSRDAIVVREMSGVITFWNDGAREMYGWTKKEALGEKGRDLLKTEFPAPREELIAKLIQDGRLEAELTNTRKDGKRVKVFSRWTLQRDEEGKPTGVMIISHDITERLKLQEQLRQAQKLESIGTLTGGIAHDFNNILGAIVINAEMALFDLPAGSSLRGNLDLIRKSGLRGKDLVRQMLLFARKSERKQEVLPLTSLIAETFKMLRSSLPTTIQMRLQMDTKSDAVCADPSQIQQVIINLCTNAAYAMRGRTGSIDISLQGITYGAVDVPEEDMQPGDYLVLSVKDTGSGMEEAIRKRVFEPFFTTKPVGEGTGLGLSVAYGIVKSHKGNITVYSEPGRGSIFRVYLPKADTGVSEKVEASQPIPKGNERILFVDDEVIIVQSVRNMLERLGYKVVTVTDSEEALKLFSTEPSQFDLVMTDQTMPSMTGEDLGKELMRIRPDIPLILCTGYSDLVTCEKATALGFQGFIMKPFTLRESAELVRRVLDQDRSK